jgi:hypothetical protein
MLAAEIAAILRRELALKLLKVADGGVRKKNPSNPPAALNET